MEDENYVIMGKVLNWIGKTIVIIFGLLFLTFVVIQLRQDPSNAIYGILVMILCGLGIYGSSIFHNYIRKKSKIDWDENEELDMVLAGIGFILFACLMGCLGILFDLAMKHLLVDQKEFPFTYTFLITYFSFICLSIWTYFSFAFGKNNALLLAYSNIISIIIILILTIFKSLPYMFKWGLGGTIGYIIMDFMFLFIISVGIKGLIVLFTPKYIKTLKNQQFKIKNIFLILILYFVMIFGYHLKPSDFNFPQKDYPALNKTK